MSNTVTNHKIVLQERPKRGPITDRTFKRVSEPLGELRDGEVRVRIDYVSVDPTQRNWLNDTRSYLPPVKIGAVMRAAAIGRVVSSKSAQFATGDFVYGTMGWQAYFQGKPDHPAVMLEHRQTHANVGAGAGGGAGGREVDHLGLFGTSGMTAYFGMFDVGRLKDGDRVVVSGAAGSVGLIATQIALAHPNCQVTAIAGTPEKVEELRKMGVHHALNYKDNDFAKQLRKTGHADVYFDNVGGTVLDLVLGQLADKARIVACGAIAAYNADKPVPIYNTPSLIAQKARMEGFIVMEYESRYAEARAWLADQVSKGKIKYDYHIVKATGRDGKRDGLDECVGALQGLFEGKNFGKCVVRVSEESERAKL